MAVETWIPSQVPLDKPNPACTYGYLRCGYHNIEPYRIVAEKLIRIYPPTARMVPSSRQSHYVDTRAFAAEAQASSERDG